MARYLNALIVTELEQEAEIINEHSDESVWAAPYASSRIHGTRTKRIVRAYNPIRMREIYGNEFADKYEKKVIEPTLAKTDILPMLGR